MLDKIKNILRKQGGTDTKGRPKVRKKTSIADDEFSNYFSQAKDWADDIYTAAIISRNRYKSAFYWAAGMASLLIITLMMLLPLHKFVF